MKSTFAALLFFITLGIVVFAMLQGPLLRKGPCSIAFLNVGQGDAIFIEGATGRQMLIDSGANQAVVRELPKVMGFFDTTIDVIVATHPDEDHIGGFPFILDKYRVGAIVQNDAVAKTPSYEAFAQAALSEGAVSIQAIQGMSIALDASTTFEVLYPDTSVKDKETNDGSIVGRLLCNGEKYLLTGDAPAAIERYLIALYGAQLKSDVLKAGHHGSKTATSKEFVEVVDPEIVIISAGKNNRYGHPHSDVVTTITESGATLRSTAIEGTIIMSDKVQ